MFNYLLFLVDAEEESKNTITWEDIWQNILAWCKTKGLQFLIGVVIVIILFILINLLARAVRKKLRKSVKTAGVANVIYSLIRKVLKFLVLITFLGYIGVDMAGISSIIASCAVAIGLALQGSLANIAGWVILMVTRPFKLGDYIEAQDNAGTVEEINLFYTHLKTPDNKVIYLPNGALSNGVIVNVSVKDLRRLDQVYSISYDDDPNKAIEVIRNIIKNNELILKDPEPFIRVSKYNDSSIDITMRVWLKSENYWNVHFDLLEQVKKGFDENNITIPFNQYDVNIIEHKEESKKSK